MPFSLELGVLLLKIGSVQQNYLSDVIGGSRAVYFPAESLPDQLGQEPAVVEMGVGEQYSIYGMGRNGKGVPVARPEFPFLIEAAIDQKPAPVGFQQICRAGDIPGCAQKNYLCLND